MARRGRKRKPVILSEDERLRLEWVRDNPGLPKFGAQAQVLLLAAEGILDQDIADQLGMTYNAVGVLRRRFLGDRDRELNRLDRITQAQCATVLANVKAKLKANRSEGRGPTTAQELAQALDIDRTTLWRRLSEPAYPLKWFGEGVTITIIAETLGVDVTELLEDDSRWG